MPKLLVRSPQRPTVELRRFDGEALEAAGLFPPPADSMSERQRTVEFYDMVRADDLDRQDGWRKMLWNIHASTAEDGAMELAGYAGLYERRVASSYAQLTEATSSIYLFRRSAQGRGVGRQAMLGVLHEAFDNRGLARVNATIAVGNHGSEKLHRRIGYVQLGGFVTHPKADDYLMTQWLAYNPDPPLRPDVTEMELIVRSAVEAGITAYEAARSAVTIQLL